MLAWVGRILYVVLFPTIVPIALDDTHALERVFTSGQPHFVWCTDIDQHIRTEIEDAFLHNAARELALGGIRSVSIPCGERINSQQTVLDQYDVLSHQQRSTWISSQLQNREPLAFITANGANIHRIPPQILNLHESPRKMRRLSEEPNLAVDIVEALREWMVSFGIMRRENIPQLVSFVSMNSSPRPMLRIQNEFQIEKCVNTSSACVIVAFVGMNHQLAEMKYIEALRAAHRTVQFGIVNVSDTSSQTLLIRSRTLQSMLTNIPNDSQRKNDSLDDTNTETNTNTKSEMNTKTATNTKTDTNTETDTNTKTDLSKVTSHTPINLFSLVNKQHTVFVLKKINPSLQTRIHNFYNDDSTHGQILKQTLNNSTHLTEFQRIYGPKIWVSAATFLENSDSHETIQNALSVVNTMNRRSENEIISMIKDHIASGTMYTPYEPVLSVETKDFSDEDAIFAEAQASIDPSPITVAQHREKMYQMYHAEQISPDPTVKTYTNTRRLTIPSGENIPLVAILSINNSLKLQNICTSHRYSLSDFHTNVRESHDSCHEINDQNSDQTDTSHESLFEDMESTATDDCCLNVGTKSNTMEQEIDSDGSTRADSR